MRLPLVLAIVVAVLGVVGWGVLHWMDTSAGAIVVEEAAAVDAARRPDSGESSRPSTPVVRDAGPTLERADGSQRRSVELDGRVPVHGTVRRPDGALAARVAIWHDGDALTHTDADGVFTATIPYRYGALGFLSARDGNAWDAQPVPRGGGVVDLTLRAEGFIAGRALDRIERTVVPHATIEALCLAHTDSGGTRALFVARTRANERGHFTLEGMPPGPASFQAHSSTHRTRAPQTVETGGRVARDVQLLLDAVGRVTGRFDPWPPSVDGPYTVHRIQPDVDVAVAADGTFNLNVPPSPDGWLNGHIALRAGHSTLLHVALRGHRLESGVVDLGTITLPSAATVQGAINLHGGLVSLGPTAVAYSLERDRPLALPCEALVQPDGEFRFDAVPAGDTLVSLRLGSMPIGPMHRVSLVAGETRKLPVFHVTPPLYGGIVTRDGGRPIAHCDVTLETSDGQSGGWRALERAKTTADGHWAIRVDALRWSEVLPTSRVRIHIAHPTRLRPAVREIDPHTEPFLRLDLALETGTSQRGTLLGGEGWTITLSDAQGTGSDVDPARSDVVAPDGSFIVDGLSGRIVSVRATDPEGVTHRWDDRRPNDATWSLTLDDAYVESNGDG